MSTHEKEEKDSPKLSIRILEICNQLQVGVQFEEDDLKITKFTSGYVNEIYKVGFLKSRPPVPESVVIKFYSPDESSCYSNVNSQLNSLLIGQAGLGPKIYLIRSDAIVMEYFDANEALTGEHDLDLSLREDLVQKLAQFNALDVPIARNNLDQSLKQVSEFLCSGELINSVSDSMKKVVIEHNLSHLNAKNLKRETNFVFDLIKKFAQNDPTIVFCHNDLSHDNLLVVPNKEKSREIKLIDFDFSSYFCRGVDLGRYFADVGQIEQFSSDELVSDHEMQQMIDWYRSESAQLHGESYLNDHANAPETLLREAKLFALYTLMVDVMFCVMAASYAEPDSRQFVEHLVNGNRRFSAYLKAKSRFTEDGSIL